MGLGVMAKGLIGIVLPGLVVLVWLVVSRQARSIPRLLSPLGIAVFLLIVVPWFVAVQQQYPGFARYFFVYHHFERFTATGFNNVKPLAPRCYSEVLNPVSFRAEAAGRRRGIAVVPTERPPLPG